MTDLPDINYQPLDQMKNAWKHAFNNSFWGWGWAGAGLVIIVSLLLTKLSAVFGGYFLIGYICYIGFLISQYKNKLWANFAAANSWPFDDITSTQVLISPGLNYGHSQDLTRVIQANVNNLQVDIYGFSCATGKGSTETTHTFTLAMVKLPKNLPHILLTSNKNPADFNRDLDNHEKLSLEGNFNKYFKLQIEKGKEVDVLSIITPDVMQVLIKYNQTENIEIFNNHLYFILKSDARNSESIRSLIESQSQLSNQIIEGINLGQSDKPAPIAGKIAQTV